MIILTIIIFTILVLLILLNIRKDGFIINDAELQEQINDIKNIEKQRSSIDTNLYYYPYNDIYNNYKKSMITNLCKKKKEVDDKTEFEDKKLKLLENKYQNLRRKISPDFNPIFSDFIQLNGYDSSNNKKHNFIKVKRYTDKTVEPPKTSFQVYTNNDDSKCLEVDNYNRYASVECDSEEDKQRFYLDYAYDKTSYEDIVKNPRFRYPEKAELLNYPITLLRSKNGNCVNLYNDQISIEPCKYKTTQMFKMKPL
jgi:hypothetical protein